MSDINALSPENAHILIVDDEASNVLLLQRILDIASYKHVQSTQDPRQVITMFRQQAFDIVLLDLNMPHMDGYDVMEQLQAETGENMPMILMLTAQHSQEYRQRALDNGALDYVTKPFNAEELLSRIRNLIDVKLARNFIQQQKDILEKEVAQRTYELQQRTSELHETRLQVVRRLGRAAEYRDNETGLHIVRMSKMAATLGKAAGMNEYECDLLLNAAPMHDIGKLGIPDNILLKPGKFEPDEWAIMQTHAQIGADILSGDDSELLNMAEEIALTHHEKWNGKGYPNGLKGENIPLSGRLCALSDVFDALTSVRPYKKAWPVDKAVDFIKEESGKHFDPTLVELFIKLLPEMVEIKEQYAEPESD